MKQRLSFTLLELMIVIAVIALAVSATTYGIPRLLAQSRCEKDLARLQGTLALAETLMCAQHRDVVITCCPSQQGVVCTLHTPHIHKRYTLKHIDFLAFNGKAAPFELVFDASICRVPQGLLELRHASSSYFLHLPGYPGGISLHPSPQPLGVEYAVSYPKELLSTP